MRKGYLAAVLAVFFCWAFVAYAAIYDESLLPEAIAKRLHPEGKLEIDLNGADPALLQASDGLAKAPGEATYKKFCAVCHAAGVAGAPKFKDAGAWAKRLEEGKPAVMKKAILGYKGMPAKGNCVKCSDEELWQAIEYMTK
ncbi:MAG: c-type cytochrome [Gammaproteobacteria bacterium]